MHPVRTPDPVWTARCEWVEAQPPVDPQDPIWSAYVDTYEHPYEGGHVDRFDADTQLDFLYYKARVTRVGGRQADEPRLTVAEGIVVAASQIPAGEQVPLATFVGTVDRLRGMTDDGAILARLSAGQRHGRPVDPSIQLRSDDGLRRYVVKVPQV